MKQLKQIQHAFIAPHDYLNFIPLTNKFHLLLAHLLTNKQYCEFYKQRQLQGDFIIIDNGAFEFKRPLEAKELRDLIGNSGIIPNIIVAPDYPYCDWQQTVDSTKEFAKTYKQYFPSSFLMAVPQSRKGDFEGWLQCHAELTEIENVKMIGMSIIGIPNAFCELTQTEDIATNRIFASAYLKTNKLNSPLHWYHYLGLGGSINELLIQRAIGIIDSNDSSSAIWHAIHNIKYDNSATGLKDGKLEIPVDFNLGLQFDLFQNVKNVELIMKNVESINNICTK